MNQPKRRTLNSSKVRAIWPLPVLCSTGPCRCGRASPTSSSSATSAGNPKPTTRQNPRDRPTSTTRGPTIRSIRATTKSTATSEASLTSDGTLLARV